MDKKRNDKDRKMKGMSMSNNLKKIEKDLSERCTFESLFSVLQNARV